VLDEAGRSAAVRFEVTDFSGTHSSVPAPPPAATDPFTLFGAAATAAALRGLHKRQTYLRGCFLESTRSSTWSSERPEHAGDACTQPLQPPRPTVQRTKVWSGSSSKRSHTQKRPDSLPAAAWLALPGAQALRGEGRAVLAEGTGLGVGAFAAFTAANAGALDMGTVTRSLAACGGTLCDANGSEDDPLLLGTVAFPVDGAVNAGDEVALLLLFGGAIQRPGTRIFVVCTLLAALVASLAEGCACASVSRASNLTPASGCSESISPSIVDRFVIIIKTGALQSLSS